MGSHTKVGNVSLKSLSSWDFETNCIDLKQIQERWCELRIKPIFLIYGLPTYKPQLKKKIRKSKSNFTIACKDYTASEWRQDIARWFRIPKGYSKLEQEEEDQWGNPGSAGQIRLTKAARHCLDFLIGRRDRWIQIAGGKSSWRPKSEMGYRALAMTIGSHEYYRAVIGVYGTIDFQI